MTITDFLAILVLYGLAPFMLWMGVRWILKGRRERKRAQHEDEVRKAAIREKKIWIQKP